MHYTTTQFGFTVSLFLSKSFSILIVEQYVEVSWYMIIGPVKSYVPYNYA